MLCFTYLYFLRRTSITDLIKESNGEKMVVFRRYAVSLKEMGKITYRQNKELPILKNC